MPDLFAPQIEEAERRAAAARALGRDRIAAPHATFVLETPGCGTCRRWTQLPGFAAIGDCALHDLTSFAGLCGDHQPTAIVPTAGIIAQPKGNPHA